MDTSEIRYRVADFLKQHPPFNAVDDADLVDLASRGRVRFFPNDEFLTWQGEPHKTHVLVIQQGTVSLWDEQGGQSELRDVRGPGDWIGAEQFYGAPSCLYTARASADVVTYGFPAYDIEALLAKYPSAATFVQALGSVTSAITLSDAAASPLDTYLQQFAGPLQSCGRQTTVAQAAKQLLDSGADALAVTDDGPGFLGILSRGVLLRWIADGAGDAGVPVSEIGVRVPGFAGPDTSVANGSWAMASREAVAMTADGTSRGSLLSLVTARDLLPAFGDQPAAILEAIGRARELTQLRVLNYRARAFILKYLTGVGATEFTTRFATAVDDAVVGKVLARVGESPHMGGWCVCGTSGRGESLTLRMPRLVQIQEGTAAADPAGVYARLTAALEECGYLPAPEVVNDPSFYVASTDEWVHRFTNWVKNPVLEGMQRNRALFDLRQLGHGDGWGAIVKAVQQAVDRDFLQILAHDCLADLPPLSFYEGAVVEHSGEYTDVFRLQRNVLQPLVDLGRVFGMAARDVMGTSTLERFSRARSLLPAHERIFREAADALRIVLWQQGRVGISQGSVGAELPPSVLSRNDRHRLRSTFPVIQELIEFAANPSWLDAVLSWPERLDALTRDL